MEQLPSKPGAFSPPVSPTAETSASPEGSKIMFGTWEDFAPEGRFVLPKSRGTAFDMLYRHAPGTDGILSAVWHALDRVPYPILAARPHHISPVSEAELATEVATLERLLDDAIASATRTGAVVDRLSRTVEAFHVWTSGQLGVRGATVSG